MKIPALGIPLGALNPAYFLDVVDAAERLGFDSVWLPEHLVFPVEMAGSPFPGADHPPVPPGTPVFDAFAYLSFLAARTERVRLGTNVYLMGLRHPFVAARAVQTLDIVSGGRAAVGVGAGWLREEWNAVGLDPRSRGRRLDEVIDVCRRLWTEERVEHRGEFYSFDEVMFEPKPVQKPHPPILIGGESPAALARAAQRGNGWFGLDHSPDSARAMVDRLRRGLAAEGRGDVDFEFICGGTAQSRAELEAYAEAGITTLMCRPWARSREAIATLERVAEIARS